MRKILVTIATILFAAPVNSEPNKVEYELSEKCSKASELMFSQTHKSNIENTKRGQIISGFENHYNSDLNKCFYKETDDIIDGKKNTVVIRLYDLNDNKNIAMLTYEPACKGSSNTIDCLFVICFIGKEKCSSNKEFEAGIKKFMGE